MWLLADICSGISNGLLLHESAFADVDLDSILDQRDSPEFEDDFLKAAEDVEHHWGQFASTESTENVIKKICETAFKKCYSYTGHPEICGYISDDFELMAKASAMSLDSPYVINMMKIYAGGGIPC